MKMISVILQGLAKPQIASNWVKAAVVPLVRWKSTVKCDVDLLDVAVVIAKPEELEEKRKLSEMIQVPVKIDLSPISGVPSRYIKDRRVRIYRPTKNAMQSGTSNLRTWSIQYNTKRRWENALMGWSSTGDSLSNMQIDFNSKEAAVEYCERNGFRWFIDTEDKPRKHRIKNYGINFSWNKRTRVSTK